LPQIAPKLGQTFLGIAPHHVSSVRASLSIPSRRGQRRTNSVADNCRTECEDGTVRYGRGGVLGRTAQQTRSDSRASGSQRDQSTRARNADAPLSSPARTTVSSVDGPNGGAPPYAILPNASGATALLESRARARELRAKGETVLDALQFLRVNDVCRLLRISKPTLWRLRRAHAFPEPTELTDRVIAWRRSEVEAWLRARTGGGHPSPARASIQPPVPLSDGDDASRLVRKAQPASPSASCRRGKVAQPQRSDAQLVLPLTPRD
jgi:predicted DNA-binding transcriptional regulator AlpA